MPTTLLLAAAALVTATLSGFLGMAGGVTLVGLMTLIVAPPLVIPLHGVVQLASNFTRTLAFLRHVYWRILAYYAVPMAVGVLLASMVWSGGKMEWFKPLIGAYLVVFLVLRRLKPKLRNPPMWNYAVLGLVTGFLAIFVGATGPFIAPFFLRDDFDKEQVIATKAVCQAWAHLLKLPAFLALGFDYAPHVGLLAIMIACVVAGTLLGKALLSRVSREGFGVAFEGVLGVLAAYLIGAYLWGA